LEGTVAFIFRVKWVAVEERAYIHRPQCKRGAESSSQQKAGRGSLAASHYRYQSTGGKFNLYQQGTGLESGELRTEVVY
jgi:hypothetical protein